MIDNNNRGGSELYFNVDVTSEDENEMIEKVAQMIHEHGFDVAAILLFESLKPLSFVGAQMGRLFISPLLPVLGEKVGISGEKLFQIMEKHENVEKLIQTIERLTQEEEKRKKVEKAQTVEGGAHKKKGWRRLIPF